MTGARVNTGNNSCLPVLDFTLPRLTLPVFDYEVEA
jgi:hypothetical protein